jgi:hypothetical protein
VPRILKGPKLQPVQVSPLHLTGLIMVGTAAASSGTAIIMHGASLPRIGVGVLVAVLVNCVVLATALLTTRAQKFYLTTRAQRFDERLDGIEADTRRGLQIHRETLDVLRGIAASYDDGAPTGPQPIQLYPTK